MKFHWSGIERIGFACSKKCKIIRNYNIFMHNNANEVWQNSAVGRKNVGNKSRWVLFTVLAWDFPKWSPLIIAKGWNFKLMTLSMWTNKRCDASSTYLRVVAQCLINISIGLVMSGKCQVFTSSLVKSNNETFFHSVFEQIFSRRIIHG